MSNHHIKSAQLFSFESDSVADATETRVTGKQNAPSLHPTKKGEVIDVVKDFQWTASLREKNIVRETPHINFREYQVVGNAVVQQAKYMLGYGFNNILGGVVGGGIAGAVVGGTRFGAAGGVVGALAGQAAMGALADTGVGKWLGLSPKGYLEPYRDLYATKPTGFQYRFPFFEENFRATMTNWQGPQVSQSPLGDLYKSLKTGGQNLSVDVGTVLNEPNTFIEESQQYEHARQGLQFQLKFYLSNTHSYADLVRNWHLTFLLLYQNLPNRTSHVLIRPPVIYEISVPGLFYHPFCFVNSLAVNYKGAQRKMKIDVSNLAEETVAFGRPAGGSRPTRAVPGELDTIIPDAYEIVMKVTPMVKETQNFMYHSAVDNNDTIYDIRVKDAVGSFSSARGVATGVSNLGGSAMRAVGL